MSEESRNTANERRIYDEIWNKGNFAVLEELVAPDYVDHDSMVRTPGREGLRQEVTRFRNAFPDLHFTIDDIVSAGDKVVTRHTATGTHRGDLPGIPATGKPVKIAGIVITRYVEPSKLGRSSTFSAFTDSSARFPRGRHRPALRAKGPRL